MIDPFTEQIEKQREAAIEKCRTWVRGWEAEQREMVLWILEEEVRDDNLLLSTKKKISLPKVKTSSPTKVNFKHEDGGGVDDSEENLETGEENG